MVMGYCKQADSEPKKAQARKAMMFAKLAPYINSHTPIPIDLMVEAFNTAADTGRDHAYRHAAGKIIPEAAIYLHSMDLSWFVSGRGSDEEAQNAIRHRKAYITRAASLLPNLLSLFEVKSRGQFEPILRRIDEFCGDYPIIKAKPHEKKARKDIRTDIQRIMRSAQDLLDRLNESGRHIDIEFDHHKSAIARAKGYDQFAHSFEPFKADLQRLVLAGHIVLYREDAGNGGFIVTDNRTKFQVVECVYEISLWQGTPAFVTTPGSDFGTACSLLYEIASGECDIGLAGAINRFAKSDKRKEIFAEEQSFQWDNSDEGMRAYEADNFAAVKEQTTRLRGEAIFWEDVIKSRTWGTFSTRELLDRKADVMEQLQRTLTEHGPHLVWGSQMSRAYKSSFDDLQEISDGLRDAEIALSKVLRQSRDD